jgi:methylated-DNA-protein-cysteine methyltransferase related protein
VNEGDPKHVAILRAVQAIPAGQVMTYGRIAEAAGLPRRARLVGMVLRRLPDVSDIPWHRVVNAAGRISQHGDVSEALQRRLLEGEGVTLDDAGRIDLALYAYVRRGKNRKAVIPKRRKAKREA